MSQNTLQAKLAYLVARTNMVKSLGPVQRLQHLDELVALQLDLFDTIVEHIDRLEYLQSGMPNIL